MPDAACFTHAGGGQDYLGCLVCIDQLGFIGRNRKLQVREKNRIYPLFQQLQGFFIIIAGKTAGIDFGGLHCKRTVHIHWEI